jgi:hypothetical protein
LIYDDRFTAGAGNMSTSLSFLPESGGFEALSQNIKTIGRIMPFPKIGVIIEKKGQTNNH